MRERRDEGMSCCPSCGGRDIAIRVSSGCDRHGRKRERFFAVCYPCKMAGAVCETEERAITAWNEGGMYPRKDAHMRAMCKILDIQGGDVYCAKGRGC